MTKEDRFFEDAFQGELEIQHVEHLGFQVLWEYAAARLEPEFAEKISLHLASCSQCTSELQVIREEYQTLLVKMPRLLPDPAKQFASAHPLSLRVGERLRLWSDWIATPKVFYRHALAAATVGVLLLVLNVWMNRQPQLYGLGGPEWWAIRVLVPWWVVLLLHGVRVVLSRGQKH